MYVVFPSLLTKDFLNPYRDISVRCGMASKINLFLVSILFGEEGFFVMPTPTATRDVCMLLMSFSFTSIAELSFPLPSCLFVLKFGIRVYFNHKCLISFRKRGDDVNEKFNMNTLSIKFRSRNICLCVYTFLFVYLYVRDLDKAFKEAGWSIEYPSNPP